ncbi:MAG: hypothetical protein RL328_1325 [Acidobacteriota bacterium]|jgi:hypothetical protein
MSSHGFGKWLTLGALLLGFGAVPLAAHHSFAAEYDANAPVEFDGVIKKLEWTNPHAHYWLEVTASDGKVTLWDFELASPNMLNRNGFTRKSIKVGDKVHVTGSRAKDGSNTAATSSIRTPSGQMLTMTGAQQGKQ